MIGIQDITTYFPEEKVDTLNMPGRDRLSNEETEYFNGVGVKNVRMSEEEDGYELARKAADKLLEKSECDAEDIDLIIFIQCRLPEYFMSSAAAKLQSEIGATNAMVYSLSDLGCADMSMALKQAKDFLVANEQAENVLICYGNKPYSPSRYRFPVTIYGDGGIALMVTRTERNQLLDISITTEGKFWDLFKVEYKDRTYDAYLEECTDMRKYGFELAILSKMKFLELNSQLLEDNFLSKEDIDHYILQNISSRAFDFYETAFDVKLSPVCQYNLSNFGHLGPADILLNYQTGLDNGLFNQGDKVLIMNNSPVASWSSILVEV